jgi:hypothetical protein
LPLRTQIAVVCALASGCSPLPSLDETPDTPALDRDDAGRTPLDRHIANMQRISRAAPWVAGNSVRLLVDGPDTYEAAFEAIRAARDHVNVETYILEADEVGHKLADLLIEKQEQGVQVNLLYDAVGSLGTPSEFFERMRASGINVCAFNPRSGSSGLNAQTLIPPVLDFITAAISNDDTAAQAAETYQNYTTMMNDLYQTYGRQVELKILNGSGTSENGVAARADAVKAVEEMGAFAVWGGPALAPSWTEEIKARGVICLGCPAIADPEPYVFPITASGDQTRLQLAEWITKKLKGGNAEHAGDPAMTSQPRVFGHVYLETVGGPQPQEAAEFKANLSEGGVELAEQISYALDPATLQEQGAGMIQRLKAAGVTTIIFNGDPIAPKIFTEEATKQNYFPEWLYGGSVLVDTNAFGRTFDQQQWAHAFGITSLSTRVAPDIVADYDLHTWYFGGLAPADDSYGVIYPQPALFFAGLQAAGPNLTAETFRDGLFGFSGTELPEPALTQPLITYGDHGLWPEAPDYFGIDDFTEIWWDPTATGEDEIRREGTGMMRFVDEGKRYRLGEWTSELKAFDPTNAPAVFETLPESETPPQYPPPPGSPAAG